jgi:uncharacterized protein (DUF885 family)
MRCRKRFRKKASNPADPNYVDPAIWYDLQIGVHFCINCAFAMNFFSRPKSRISFWITFGALLILIFFDVSICSAQTKVVGYVTNHRHHAIDYEKLTHLNLAFENPDIEGKVSFSPFNDKYIRDAHSHGVKVLVSLAGGGASHDPKMQTLYFDLLKDAKRSAFVEKILSYTIAHNIDGVDVDLEGPAINSDYPKFIAALSTGLKKQGKLLTSALSHLNGASKVPDSTMHLFDFINIMAYDETGPWRPDKGGQHSSFEFALQSLDYWTKRGLPKGKAVLGVPFYGYGFGKDFNQGIGFAQIIERFPDAENDDIVGDKIYYNGLSTIARKTQLVVDQGFGGVMIWQLAQDASGNLSLLKTIDKVIHKNDSRLGQRSENSDRLQSITTHYYADYLALNPLAATSRGQKGYDDKMEINISERYIKQGLDLNRKYLDSLKGVDINTLPASDKLTAQIFKFLLTRELDGFERGITTSCMMLRPVDQFVFSFPTSFATNASGTGAIPFRSVRNYDDFLKRLAIFSQWVDIAIANMNTGISKGNTVPKASMLKVPAQLKPLFETETPNHIFYKPVLSLPDSFSAANKKRLTVAYTKAVNNIVKPAYKKLHDYIVNVYIPKARTTSGLLDNAGGKDEYRYWLHYWNTQDLDPDSVFAYGLSEVARIRDGMDSIKTATGFKDDLASFFHYVKTDKKFFPFTTEAEVLDRFRSFQEKMSPSLKSKFNLVPKSRFEIRATEKFRQAGANAQYIRPARDGSRPGVFYEVIPDPLSYNVVGMETLFLHEAIPGHHFQASLQQEMTLPEFRGSAFFAAFSEGWGLYAETLGLELGMYSDPYQYLGHLNADMERSVRLVVDVGIHHKGWTRERAIQYILENQPVTPDIAAQRIERYMVIPGQALSYKIGERKILFLRKLAQDKLGDAFDIREFHDQVLKDGAMPLDILDEKIRAWIDSKG